MRHQRLSILRIAAALTSTMVVVMTTIAEAQDDAATRLRAAYELAYNLDHEEAVREMQAVAKLSPELSTTYRALASVTWLRYLFGRGTVLVDEYLGRISKRDVSTAAAPPEVADSFRNYLSTAIRLAEQRVAQHPRDPRALYELSSALGLQASWAATVEGRMSRAFGSARRAYRIAEHASAASPAAVEPRLVLGTYRYVVAGLNLPARMVAFMAGMDGDRAKGLQLVEEAARADDSAVQTEARFALVLLYNREKRWDDAMAVLADLRRAYPRNRLLWLETGSTALRAGRPGEADRWLTEGLAMCGRDDRRRMYGEDALWRYKRGTARMRLQRPAEAREDLLAGLAAPEARDWVRGRSHLELADASLVLGDRAQARWQAGKAIPLLERGQDAEGVRLAKRLLERLGRD
jgi:predicted Zn-dependent protease